MAKLVEYARLTLPCPIAEWLDQALGYPGVRLLDLTPPIVEDILDLRRDDANPVDPNAIAAYHRAGRIGFLPNDVAQRLAPELDAGEVITARVVRVTQADVPEITLELAL